MIYSIILSAFQAWFNPEGDGRIVEMNEQGTRSQPRRGDIVCLAKQHAKSILHMKRLLLLMPLFYLSACQNATVTESAAPLIYKEKTGDHQECVEENCATVKLVYPVFEGDTALAEIVNRQVMEQNFSMWVTGDQEFKGMEDAVSSFFEDYKRFRTDFPEAAQEWTFETVAKVTHQSDSLISIRFENFSYLGGAHPNTVVLYLNLDLSENADVLVHEKMLIDRAKLLKLAEEKFREYHEVDATVTLEEDGRFFLDEGEFFLPAAMGYEEDKMVLLYNAYEIGPYAMGRTELRFPLEELEGVVYVPQ